MTYSWKNSPHKHDEEYYMIVGYLTVQCNHFESALSSLTCAVAGIDFNERHTFLRHFGNVSVCEFLRDIATSRSRNEDAHRAISAACAAFDVLRGNRNLVLHNNMTLKQDVNGHWQEVIRSKPTNKMKNARTDLVSLDKIKQTIDEMEEWGAAFLSSRYVVPF